LPSLCWLSSRSPAVPRLEKKTESTEHLPMVNLDYSQTGRIEGRVVFRGTPPAPVVIDMSSNPTCERQHKTPVKSENIVVNKNGTLKNVFVYIAKGLPRVKWPVPQTPRILNQDGCVYTPHVLGLMKGQQLEIVNSDPVNHNVHAEAKVNAEWNESQPPRAEHKFKTLRLRGSPVPHHLQRPPWMRAWVGVSEHLYFEVSDGAGAFLF
jgi:hypothetical protein